MQRTNDQGGVVGSDPIVVGIENQADRTAAKLLLFVE